MATSAFKSTTKRTSIRGSSSSEDSSSASRSLRRSRSLSRFSRPIPPDHETEPPVPDYNKNGPRGKFVNTARGTAAFPEISLDDLALEFFGSSSRTENESDGGVRERKEREGRTIGRWASDTASSRIRGRSVSRSRGDIVSSSSSFGAKELVSAADAGSRRRKSLSVARHQISDSESEVDHSWSSSNRANVKAPISGNSQMPLAPKASNRRLGRSQSCKDPSMLHDGYSSHSSALTDDESKDTCFEKNGIEKIIRAVYAQKKVEHPTEDVANGGLYEAMRTELRHAVEEIRTELNQAMGRQADLTSGGCLQSDNSEALHDFSPIRKTYATKFVQLEKRKQDLLTEMLLEKQRGQDAYTIVKELPGARTPAIEEQPSRARKRSSDRNWMSKRLTEEAERYFEDFISNVEDTDISSLDGERSDGSSTLGGKERDATIRLAETYKSPAGSTSHSVEMDGVYLPWLQWETSHDGSLLGKNKTQTPVTPKTLQWDSEKDMVSLHDPSSHSTSSHGSWSPGVFSSSPMDKRGDTGKSRQVGNGGISCFDMDEYLKLANNEEVLFEMYRQRNRINSGTLLLCTDVGVL